ncbi:hypothetical protein TNCV_4486551 [Trichonephila clavipes]|nr:hypothetical protein TNCV_4486551 [Trichonephila clavipes]
MEFNTLHSSIRRDILSNSPLMLAWCNRCNRHTLLCTDPQGFMLVISGSRPIHPTGVLLDLDLEGRMSNPVNLLRVRSVTCGFALSCWNTM